MAERGAIRIEGGNAFVQLSRGYEAIINSSDVPLVSDYAWCASKGRNTFYATSTVIEKGAQKWVGMHRLIMRAKKGEIVDHIDGNGLNNTRENLRVCSNQQNIFNQTIRSTNKSGHKGVHWNRALGKWRSQIQIDGKIISLGCFSSIDAAADAYARASKTHHGEYSMVAD